MGEWSRELVVGFRQLRQSRGAVASLTLAIGLSIGANLAVVVQLYDVLAPRSPFRDSAGLVVIEHTGGYFTQEADSDSAHSRRLSRPDFQDLQQQQASFTAVGAIQTDYIAMLSGADRPRTVCRIFVSPRALELLGVVPTIGRSFGPGDFDADAGGVALLADGLWRRYFAASASVVGRSVRLDEQPFSVVGVLPRHAAEMLQPRTSLFGADGSALCVITPLVRGRAGEAEGVLEYLRTEGARNLPAVVAVGRLRSGASNSEADSELAVIAGRLRPQHPPRPGTFGLRAVPFRTWRIAAIRPLLLMLAVAAALTLLVACANAAGLLMAESVRRAPELATRIALGASPGHLVRVIAARSLVWSLPGGVLGIVLANAAVGLLRWGVAPGRDPIRDLPLQAWLLIAGAMLTLVIALSSGAAAVWALRGQDLNQSLRNGAQSASGFPRLRAAMVLLTIQVSAAVALTFGAGLLLRSVWILTTSDYGFDLRDGFVIQVQLPRSRYPGVAEQVEFYQHAMSRIRGLPGVTAAGFSSSPPLADAVTTLSGSLKLTTPARTRDIEQLRAQFVSSGYFEALGVKPLRGRLFSQADERAGGSTIVVDEAFCRRLLSGDDPLGAVLWFGRDALRIVGVIGDTRQSLGVDALSRREAADGTVYLSTARFPRPPTWGFLVARTLPGRADVGDGVVGALLSIDASAVVGEPRSFTDLLSTKTAGQRRLSVLLAVMGSVVLLLTAASLTGAFSQLVTLRSREIAIRYCLGAGHGRIVGLTVRHVGATIGSGLVVGVAAGLVLGRALASQLYGVTPTDAWTLASALGLLLIISVVAAAGPLRRAFRVDLPGTLRST